MATKAELEKKVKDFEKKADKHKKAAATESLLAKYAKKMVAETKRQLAKAKK